MHTPIETIEIYYADINKTAKKEVKPYKSNGNYYEVKITRDIKVPKVYHKQV